MTIVLSTMVKAQVRSGYFMEGYTMSHEMNPALQPACDYMTVPLLGGIQANMNSSIGMGDILFVKKHNTLTTFMSKETISKSELMDKVGNGVNLGVDARINLFSMGRRMNDDTFGTLGVALRADGAGFLSKGLFDCLKDIENKDYIIDNTGVKASTYLEISAGGSRKVNNTFSMGAKAKLLVGLMNANLNIDKIELNVSSETSWTANGHATINVSGMKYKTEIKDYDGRQGYYEQISDLRFGGFDFHGIGLAVDGGVTLKPDEHWDFSAAIIDFGFMTWLSNRKGENAGEPFSFDGFKDLAVEKSDENSLKNQWSNIHDNLSDLVRLEDKGYHTFNEMLGATVNIGALYRIDSQNRYKIGMLFSGRIDEKYSWWETRINATIKPIAKTELEFCASPFCSTFGTGIGAMINYVANNGLNLYLASDRLFFKVNPQMIPTSLNGTIQIGAAVKLK